MIVAVTILLASVEQGKPVSALAGDLPRRFTHSDRIKAFPTEISQARRAALHGGDFARDKVAIEAMLAADFGEVVALDATDGLRITFASGEIAHLRPSGNAPELRAYTEADSPERAAAMSRGMSWNPSLRARTSAQMTLLIAATAISLASSQRVFWRLS